MTRKKFIASLAFREREAKRRAAQATRPPLKEGKIMNERNANVFVGCGTVLALTVLCMVLAFGGWYILGRPGLPVAAVPAPVTTQAPAIVTEAPVAPVVTEAPEVPAPTDAPAPTEAPAPVAVSCDTPSIQAETTLDGKSMSASGEFLDTILGKRMTFPSRRLVVPAKAWNEVLTAEELLAVETTWQSVQVCVPEGMWGTVFAGGYEQGLNRSENGVLMTLGSGLYEFNIRNGEVVLWYPQQESFAAKDLDRIIEQINNGNFDIKNALAFFGVTADLLPKIPSELVKERNVQLVSAPEPIKR